MNVLCFDTETDGIGGFNPPRQRVVQIAWDLNDETKNYLISDVTDISPRVPHPFKVSDCRKVGVSFKDAFEDFMNALRKCDMAAAHNLSFDKGVLLNELRLRNIVSTEFLNLINEKEFCTLQKTINICRIPKTGNAARYGGYKYPSLSELYVKLTGMQPKLDLHDARNDIQVLKTCITLLAEKNLAGLSLEIEDNSDVEDNISGGSM